MKSSRVARGIRFINTATPASFRREYEKGEFPICDGCRDLRAELKKLKAAQRKIDYRSVRRIQKAIKLFMADDRFALAMDILSDLAASLAKRRCLKLAAAAR